MTAQEYKDALEALKLTQLDAGELFNIGPRTSRRWALGEARIPASVAMILRLMLRKRVSPSDVVAAMKG
jgi:hypothetical protein